MGHLRPPAKGIPGQRVAAGRESAHRECVVYNQLMSAMRHEFGGQVEKPAATSLEG